MKWISLIFATVSMAALGWLVWQLATLQERRAAEKERRRADDVAERDRPLDEADETTRRSG